MNKYMISLVMMFVTMLGVSNVAFGMNPENERDNARHVLPASFQFGGGYVPNKKKTTNTKFDRIALHTDRAAQRDDEEITSQRGGGQSRQESQFKHELQKNKLIETALRKQLTAKQKDLDKAIEQLEENEENEKLAPVRTAFSVVRAVGVAVVATWRICHYTNLLCENFGTPAWLSAGTFNLGCMMAAGAVAIADYAFPGKVGIALGTLGLADFVGNKYFSKASA